MGLTLDLLSYPCPLKMHREFIQLIHIDKYFNVLNTLKFNFNIFLLSKKIKSEAANYLIYQSSD